jgi:hypothetical protein
MKNSPLMSMEEINEMWSKDCIIDETRYIHCAQDQALLHSKYLRQFHIERKEMRELQIELEKLKLEAERFYAGDNTKEHHEKGWELPPWGFSERGRKKTLLKDELNRLVNTNHDVISLTLKLADQTDKVEAIESIMKEISRRSFIMNNMNEYRKLTGT